MLTGGGVKVPGGEFLGPGKEGCTVVAGAYRRGPTPFPRSSSVQDEHERVLVERLSGLGVQVELPYDAGAISNWTANKCGRHSSVTTTVRRTSASDAVYLAGCDAAFDRRREPPRDRVSRRHLFRHLFCRGRGSIWPESNEPARSTSIPARSDFLAVFPLRERAGVRLVGTVIEQSRAVATR